MIKNIIFDLGGVLIDWNPKNVFKEIFPNDEQTTLFLEHICKYSWNLKQDEGRLLSDATSILQSQHPEWHNEIAAYYGKWEQMLVGPITESVTILEELVNNPKFKVLALTNWSAETFPIAKSRYAFLDWFEGIVVSGDEKCIKPNRRIYDIILNRYQLKPSESLFIDDNLDNTKAAALLGIKTHHFTTSQNLRRFLEYISILNPSK